MRSKIKYVEDHMQECCLHQQNGDKWQKINHYNKRLSEVQEIHETKTNK